MSDKLPQKVEIVEPRGAEWAKEATLASLTAAVGVSNKLLKAIGGEKTKSISLTDLSRFNDKIKDTTEGFEGVDAATRDLKGTLLGVTKSLYGNSAEIARNATNLASSADSASGFMRTLSHTGSQVTGAIGGMGRAGAVVAAGMTAVSAATMLVVDRVMASRDAFMNMTQAGLYFSGNSLEFAARVRESGLELQQFTGIAEKYNVALLTSAGAESGYLRSVRELSGTFSTLNMSLQDGAEYFAEFLEQTRLANAGYMQDELTQREAFRKNAEIQQELARITGVSVKEQREQARASAASRQVQAMMMSVDKEEGERLQRVISNLVTIQGLSQQQAEQAVLAYKFQTPIAGAFMRSQAMDPGMAARTREEVLTGGTQESARRMAEQQRAAAGRYRESSLSQLMTVLMGLGREEASIITASYARAFGIDVTRPGAAGGPPGQPVDAATRAVNDLVTSTLQAIGAIDATIIRGAAEGLRIFRTQIEDLNGILRSINTQNISEIFTSLRDTMVSVGSALDTLSDILGTLGSAITGLSGIVTRITGLSGGEQALALAGVYGASKVLGAARAAAPAAATVTALAPAAAAAAVPAAVAALAGVLGYSIYKGVTDPNGPARVAAINEQLPGAMGSPGTAQARLSARARSGQDAWTSATASINRVETAIEQRNVLNEMQRQDLRQQIDALQGTRTTLEGMAQRSTTEQELLQRIADAIEGGNNRLTREIIRSSER